MTEIPPSSISFSLENHPPFTLIPTKNFFYGHLPFFMEEFSVLIPFPQPNFLRLLSLRSLFQQSPLLKLFPCNLTNFSFIHTKISFPFLSILNTHLVQGYLLPSRDIVEHLRFHTFKSAFRALNFPVRI